MSGRWKPPSMKKDPRDFRRTIGNPKLDVVDIEKLAETAHKHNLPLVMDNTVATAYLVRPIEKERTL